MKATAYISATLAVLAALLWALTADDKPTGGLKGKASDYRNAIEDAATLIP